MPNPVAGTQAPLQFAIQQTDQNGNLISTDLTGATVTLVLTSPTGTRTTYPATISNASAGIVTVLLNGAAIPVAGIYQLQWDVVFANGAPGDSDPIGNLLIGKAL